MKAQDLKNSILQLAIQGKLVAQDTNDEPAEVLYAKIQAEKQKLIKEGKIKKDKPLPLITDDEIPFEIPSTWKWVRLGDCSTVYTGNSIPEDIKRHRYTGISEGYDYIGTKDVNFDLTINYNNGVKIPYSEPKFKLANKNSILLCIEGGSAGRKLAIVDRDVCFGNKLCSINPINISMMYIFYFIQSPYFRSIFNDNATGIIGGVSVNKLQELLIPLPPLAEQKRIVLKFEALNPLIKRYDKVETELAELIDDFPEQLKKSGLKFYLNNSDFPVYRLENIITFGPKNGYSPKAVDYETKIKNLTLTATSSGKFDKKYFKYVDIDIPTDSYLWLKKGDILIQRGNALSYVGISAVYDNNETNYIYPDLMVKIIANPKIVDSGYLHLYLNSPEIRKYYMDAAIGTSDSMPKINHKIILNTQIKIPPLAEQHRIVAKVNELMQYCEELTHPEKRKNVEPITIEWLIDKGFDSCKQNGYTDINAILDELNIAVMQDRNLKKGRIEYNNDKFQIWVNDLNDNWTKTHELVHYVNDNNEIKLYGAVGRKDETSLSKSKERNVDALTAEILMPEDIFISAVEQDNIRKYAFVDNAIVRKLGKQFRVSDDAVKIRLQNLGYHTK